MRVITENIWFWAVLALLAGQRLWELRRARQSASWMRQHGAIEVGRGHYAIAVLLPAAFVLALTMEVLLMRLRPAGWVWAPLACVLGAWGLRIWSIRSLGVFWNTRILVLPGTKAVHTGPYRFMRHPYYVSVMIELAMVPVMFQAYWTAIAFTIVNGFFLLVRIPAEERALLMTTDYASAFYPAPDLHRHEQQ